MSARSSLHSGSRRCDVGKINVPAPDMSRKAIFIIVLAAAALTACEYGMPKNAADSKGQGESEILQRLAYEKGEVVWRVREKNTDGSEYRSCFQVPHNGGVIYWPSRHTLAFTLNQGGHHKTLTATYPPKPEHEVVFYWDQISESMSLSVDGKPADSRVVADERRPWRLTCPF